MRIIKNQFWATKFKDFLECKEGKYLDFNEMCNAVLNCRANSALMEVNDNRAEGKFYVILNSLKYSVVSRNKKSEHRFGDGGEFEFMTFLKRNGKSILISRLFESYGTYSDDSMDYKMLEIRDSYLLVEDVLGRRIFSRLGC